MKPVKITRSKFALLEPGDVIQKRIEKRPTMFIEEGNEFTVISNDPARKKVLVTRKVGNKEYRKNINYEGEGIEGMMANGEVYDHKPFGTEMTSYWLMSKANMNFIRKFLDNLVIIAIVIITIVGTYYFLKYINHIQPWTRKN